ncbi:MAG: GIY-YIG nuclease family protein [Bacteroidetes bacterium]|nr:GIY-YIG nuclease family protein [Bacteroidota bacterium]
MKNYYVYILKCSDDSYYTGVTNNLERRFIEHEEGIDSECYTFSRRPLEIVFYQMYNDIHQAIAIEKKIKKWSRKKKEAIIQDKWDDLKELSICKNETSHLNSKKVKALRLRSA